MKQRVKVEVGGVTLWAEAGQTLGEILGGEKPCGGHGKCGKCKVIARGHLSQPNDTERECLSETELAQGVRLACLTRVLGNCEVEPFGKTEKTQIVTEGILPEFSLQNTYPTSARLSITIHALVSSRSSSSRAASSRERKSS